MAAGFELLATGVFLYSVGAYIYLFDPMQKFKTVAVLLVIPVTYGLIYVSSFNADRNSIRSYIQSGSTDPYSHNIPVYGNSSLVILILAIVIFELFRRIKLRRSAVINFLGAGTFMVYLLHDNTLFYTWWNKQHWTVLLEKSPIRFLGSISLWTFITFGTGIVAYAAYLLLCKLGADCKHLVIRSD